MKIVVKQIVNEFAIIPIQLPLNITFTGITKFLLDFENDELNLSQFLSIYSKYFCISSSMAEIYFQTCLTLLDLNDKVPTLGLMLFFYNQLFLDESCTRTPAKVERDGRPKEYRYRQIYLQQFWKRNVSKWWTIVNLSCTSFSKTGQLEAKTFAILDNFFEVADDDKCTFETFYKSIIITKQTPKKFDRMVQAITSAMDNTYIESGKLAGQGLELSLLNQHLIIVKDAKSAEQIITIHRVHNSRIWIQRNFKYLTLSSCRNTELVFENITGQVVIRKCTNVIISGYCTSLRVQETLEGDVNINVGLIFKPVIIGNEQTKIRVGPPNIWQAFSDTDFKQYKENMWQWPLLMGIGIDMLLIKPSEFAYQQTSLKEEDKYFADFKRYLSSLPLEYMQQVLYTRFVSKQKIQILQKAQSLDNSISKTIMEGFFRWLHCNGLDIVINDQINI